jgi:hypothetical protein
VTKAGTLTFAFQGTELLNRPAPAAGHQLPAHLAVISAITATAGGSSHGGPGGMALAALGPSRVSIRAWCSLSPMSCRANRAAASVRSRVR